MVSLRVAASPERTFEVFTAQIGLWWRPSTLFVTARREPGRLVFEGGAGGRLVEIYPDGAVFEIGRILVWEPGAHLSLTWRQAGFAPDQSTRVDVRFEAVGSETRVTVEHSGWDAIPRNHAARHGFPLVPFQQRLAEYWQTGLATLAGRLVADQSVTPPPSAT
jgi:uncharacterized protein YndB with AHSA1/START domain